MSMGKQYNLNSSWEEIIRWIAFSVFWYVKGCLLPWAWKLPLLITAVFGARSIKMRGKDFFRNFDIETHIASVTIEKPYFIYNNKYHGYKIECITYSTWFIGFQMQHVTFMWILCECSYGKNHCQVMVQPARMQFRSILPNTNWSCCLGWTPSDAQNNRQAGARINPRHTEMGHSKLTINLMMIITPRKQLDTLFAAHNKIWTKSMF